MFDVLLDVIGDMALLGITVLAVMTAAVTLYVNWRGIVFVLRAIQGGIERANMEHDFKLRYRAEEKKRIFREKKAERERLYLDWKSEKSKGDFWRI